MRFRFFGRIIIIPVWVKYTVIGLVFAALTALGVLINNRANSGVLRPAGETQASSGTPSFPSGDQTPSADTPSPSPEQTLITVYIVGAVIAPDVYDIPEGSILNDLVKLAGGFASGADREAVNLASILKNGMMIRIPYTGDKDKKWVIDEGTSGGSSTKISDGGLININTATVAELCELPGVGESTALKIISYRTENGPFNDITDIMKVGGIKTAKFNEIKNYITVG